MDGSKSAIRGGSVKYGVDWTEETGDRAAGLVICLSSLLLNDAATWAPITPSPCKLILLLVDCEWKDTVDQTIAGDDQPECVSKDWHSVRSERLQWV